MLKSCAERFDSQDYKGVIGHSFACDLAQSLIGQTKRPIDQLVLVAPIRDLPIGFANLADKLKASDSTKWLREIAALRPSLKSSPEEIGVFWQVVQDILAQPRFYREFWSTEEKTKEYESLLPSLPGLDGGMWQAGLNDFLMNREAPKPASCERMVMLGKDDSYHANFTEEKAAWEDRGFRVHVFPQAGHFPHIEADCLRQLVK